jgi:hypothetical protein
MIDDNSTPTNYYRALKDISAWVPKDGVIIGEGANTMDIGRTPTARQGSEGAAGCRQLWHDGHQGKPVAAKDVPESAESQPRTHSIILLAVRRSTARRFDRTASRC